MDNEIYRVDRKMGKQSGRLPNKTEPKWVGAEKEYQDPKGQKLKTCLQFLGLWLPPPQNNRVPTPPPPPKPYNLTRLAVGATQHTPWRYLKQDLHLRASLGFGKLQCMHVQELADASASDC